MRELGFFLPPPLFTYILLHHLSPSFISYFISLSIRYSHFIFLFCFHLLLQNSVVIRMHNPQSSLSLSVWQSVHFPWILPFSLCYISWILQFDESPIPLSSHRSPLLFWFHVQFPLLCAVRVVMSLASVSHSTSALSAASPISPSSAPLHRSWISSRKLVTCVYREACVTGARLTGQTG